MRESVCSRERSCSLLLPARWNWTRQHTVTQWAPNGNQFNDVLLLFPTLRGSDVEQSSCLSKVTLLAEDADFILGFLDREKKKKSRKPPPSERLRPEYNLKQPSFLASNIKALTHIKKTNSIGFDVGLRLDKSFWPEFEKKLTRDLKWSASKFPWFKDSGGNLTWRERQIVSKCLEDKLRSRQMC